MSCRLDPTCRLRMHAYNLPNANSLPYNPHPLLQLFVVGCARLPRTKLVVSVKVLMSTESFVAVFSAGEPAAPFAIGVEVVTDNTVEEVDTEVEVARVADELNVLSGVKDVVGLAILSIDEEVVKLVVLSIVDACNGRPAWEVL
jgi:hypothetical protein